MEVRAAMQVESRVNTLMFSTHGLAELSMDAHVFWSRPLATIISRL